MGGTGERRTLRLVAQYADARNLFDIPDGGATIRHKLQVLAEHCAAVGRAREEIETTVSTRFAPGQAPAAFIEHCAELAGLGVDHAVVLTSGAWTGASVEALAPVVTDLSTVPARDATERVRGQVRGERLRCEGDDHRNTTAWSQPGAAQAGRHTADHDQRLAVGDAAPSVFERRMFRCLDHGVEERLRKEPYQRS